MRLEIGRFSKKDNSKSNPRNQKSGDLDKKSKFEVRRNSHFKKRLKTEIKAKLN